jgi:DNA-binding HxlR family transcriptional regulator
MKIRNEYTCPLEIVHDIIKGKWKPIIIYHLRTNSLSLSQLEKGIAGINQKMLLQQLRELKEFGIIEKKEYKGYPLHVEYFLTKKRGHQILQAICIMQQVGIEFMLENGMEKELRLKGLLD